MSRPIPKPTVDAILRAFAIVETLAETREGSTVTELARLEDVNKALTHRALVSLESAGYVVQDEQSQRYRLTPRLLAVAMGYYDSLGIRGVAGPILQALADETGCNAEFTRYMDGELRLLMWVPPRQRAAGLQVVSRPGDIQPAHATAAGKVWLASLDDVQLRRQIGDAPLPRLGRATITDPVALVAEVQRVRTVGYATNHEEHGEGYVAVAVPVFPPDGQGLLGSLGLTRPLTGAPFSIPSLAEAAGRAAQKLGAVLPRGGEMASLAAGRSY